MLKISLNIKIYPLKCRKSVIFDEIIRETVKTAGRLFSIKTPSGSYILPR